VARIVDYARALAVTQTLGLRCAYYNAGAFAFGPGETVHVVGWLGPPDPTVHTGRGFVLVPTPAPYPANLAARLGRVWPDVVGGEAWVMPKAHWSFELGHGNGDWLAPALDACGVDPDALRPRTDGSAIAFDPGDPAALALIRALLTDLKASDFAVLFPAHRHLVTLHHHQQIWWQTPDADLAERLAKIDQPSGPGGV
jgi:hypothetical protein